MSIEAWTGSFHLQTLSVRHLLIWIKWQWEMSITPNLQCPTTTGLDQELMTCVYPDVYRRVSLSQRTPDPDWSHPLLPAPGHYYVFNCAHSLTKNGMQLTYIAFTPWLFHVTFSSFTISSHSLASIFSALNKTPLQRHIHTSTGAFQILLSIFDKIE